MTDPTPLITRAHDLDRQATEEDKKQNFEEAYRLYKTSIQYLLQVLKCNVQAVERNPILSTNLHKNAERLMKRAEEIRAILENTALSNQAALRDQAIALARQATGEDKKGNFEEAYKLYKSSIQHFLQVLKCTVHAVERDPILKENISKKMEELMKRAEEVHMFLENSSKKILSPGEKKEIEDARLKSAFFNDLFAEKPTVKWSDVIGLDMAKETLREAVILPVRFPKMFVGLRTPCKGVLLYGPPGAGKSFLANACATEAGTTFLRVSYKILLSKNIELSEGFIRDLFETARASRPAIIFIDQIDCFWPQRSDRDNDTKYRMKTEFLMQMQGVGKDDQGIFVLGATNVPWELDQVVRRRFEKRIYISLLEESARKELLKLIIGDTPNSLTEEDFDSLARVTEGFSGLDIAKIIKNAGLGLVQMCESAQYFRETREETAIKYTPCAPSDPEARPMSLMELPPNSLKVPDLTAVRFT